MASIFSHAAVPLAAGMGLGKARVPPRLLALGVLACIVPDLDVLAFPFGVAYDSPLAHRGFTHSLAFAALLGAAAAAGARVLRTTRWAAFLFVAFSAASHGVLDAFTTGGAGIMFFWPFDEARYFFPWRVILVSPIGVRGFFSEYGAQVMKTELVWVWLPAILLSGVAYAARRRHNRLRPKEIA